MTNDPGPDLPDAAPADVLADLPTDSPPAPAFCRDCGAALPGGARFCPVCGAATVPAAREDPISVYGTIATAVLIGLVGLILIPITILLWETAATPGDITSANVAALIFAALTVTMALFAVIAADVAFVVHLSRPTAREWRSWTQFFILPIWLLAATAALILIADS